MLLKFMKKTPGGLYVWPEKEDLSWETKDHVIYVVESPSLENERESSLSLKTLFLIKLRQSLKELE